MTDINPIAGSQRTALESAAKPARHTTDEQAPARSGDRVELSENARLLSKLKELPEIREGLVNSVKAQILAGNYDTPERFDTAINALIDDLDE